MAVAVCMSRLQDLVRFYEQINRLINHAGGFGTLADLRVGPNRPERGVYFFFELGEARSESGTGLRVVRVGTHALIEGSKASLTQRLVQHRGRSAENAGGNHRGSIFRLLLGEAITAQSGAATAPSWGVASHLAAAASRLQTQVSDLRLQEEPVEQDVSKYVRSMPFICLPISDAAGPESLRGTIERNAIALLSNWDRAALDAPSMTWLGRFSSHTLVRDSGMWNQRHVKEKHQEEFLAMMEAITTDVVSKK